MEAWHYQPAADINCTLTQRLRRFPREPDILSSVLRSVCALGLRTWLRLYHRLSIHGRENLPANASFVMVANHSSHLDALCLLAALPLGRLHQAFPVAAADYFFVSLSRVAMAAILINALPFDRATHVRRSLELCRGILANQGNVLIVFPEGTRGPGGSLGVFRPGIGKLLAGSATPCVPCYIDGAAEALPKGSWLPRPRTLRLTIGKPLVFKDYFGGRDEIHAISNQLRQAVLELAPVAAAPVQ